MEFKQLLANLLIIATITSFISTAGNFLSSVRYIIIIIIIIIIAEPCMRV